MDENARAIEQYRLENQLRNQQRQYRKLREDGDALGRKIDATMNALAQIRKPNKN